MQMAPASSWEHMAHLWHTLTFTTCGKPSHVLPTWPRRKPEKAGHIISNFSFPKASPRDEQQGTAVTQAICVWCRKSVQWAGSVERGLTRGRQKDIHWMDGWVEHKKLRIWNFSNSGCSSASASISAGLPPPHSSIISLDLISQPSPSPLGHSMPLRSKQHFQTMAYWLYASLTMMQSVGEVYYSYVVFSYSLTVCKGMTGLMPNVHEQCHHSGFRLAWR